MVDCERSWLQVFFQEWPKYLVTVWANLKNVTSKVKKAVTPFGATFCKPLATFLFQHLVTSGHTDYHFSVGG